MSHLEFKHQLHEYSQWRNQLLQSIEMYMEWRKRYDLNDAQSAASIANMLHGLRADRITLAFVAEFSRGKTELINALFFAETGVRLLPSAPGRTTMSPTEIFYDPSGSYIRLLNIESRLEDISLNEFKQIPERWVQIDLDCTSPTQMQKTFKELIATKLVDRELAIKLGLWSDREAAEQGITNPEKVEIPCWRHALISFPHPLLMEGLAILDTPGLNALGTEPELTLSMLPSAQAIIFVLAADTGVTKSDMEMWRSHVCNARGNNKQGLAVVLNKIDSMWDDLSGEGGFEAAIRSQVTLSAKSLDIQEEAIFPISAKQALLAKVKSDGTLLEKSRLGTLEEYLSEKILKQRRKILITIIDREIGYLIRGSVSLTESQLNNARKQLEEFKKIDFDNSEMTGKLLAETRDGQNLYLANIENFKASRNIFAVQAKMLIDSFATHKIDQLIKTSRIEMANNLTTYGMKQSIRKLFNDLR
ncbi:MAG: dynamin family protein, partial [Methylococcaceae bacterium]|nr:dynamin family protein [Methylococcaceae bacterium]